MLNIIELSGANRELIEAIAGISPVAVLIWVRLTCNILLMTNQNITYNTNDNNTTTTKTTSTNVIYQLYQSFTQRFKDRSFLFCNIDNCCHNYFSFNFLSLLDLLYYSDLLVYFPEKSI